MVLSLTDTDAVHYSEDSGHGTSYSSDHYQQTALLVIQQTEFPGQLIGDMHPRRARIKQQLPVAGYLDDITLCVTVNDEIKLLGEGETPLKNGDHVKFVPQIAGG